VIYLLLKVFMGGDIDYNIPSAPFFSQASSTRLVICKVLVGAVVWIILICIIGTKAFRTADI
jgi:hypothetical protein